MNGPATRYRLRRHAHRMRRYGLQPMTIINPGDPLPDVAAVVIGRWLWRYRSELTPASTAMALFAAAWLLHRWHPGWWPMLIGLTAVASAAPIARGRRLGLPTRAERWYAAFVAAVAGGWLAAATVAGPLTTPLPTVLAIAAAILGVPWWAHRRRRARVRVERKLEVWPQIAREVGLTGSQVMSAVVDVWGWRARVRLARGQTIDDARAKLAAIESGLGVFRGAARIYPTADDLANRFELRVLDKDPHADAITWPGPSVTTITEPIDLGPFEDAAPARVLLLRRHALFAGSTGSGKSGGLNVLMGNLTACTDVVIWAVDLKRGMELGPWEPCLGRLATNPAEALALLADAVAILDARAGYLTSRGLRVWEPTPELPELIIIIDEYAELTESASDAAGHADSIARRGRAPAVNLIVATQRPTQKAMGQGAVRSQMDVRLCFRVRERRDVDLILGQGMLAAGWHAHTLNAPGKFLISAPEHDTPRRARAYLVTDEAVRQAVTRHAPLRPALDPISLAAIGGRAQIAPDQPAPPLTLPHDQDEPRGPEDDRDTPEAVLRAALSLAGEDGISVTGLMAVTGMGRRWVYYRLRDLAGNGDVIQTVRGTWRTTRPERDSR